jgi:DNA ligase (NAD+)
MEISELKKKIIKANKAYRSGKPIIDDITYDELLDDLAAILPEDEFEAFRNSLNEGVIEKSKQKIHHTYIAGSLDKFKFDEPEALKTFFKKYIKSSLNISAKVDGISGIAHYVNGKLVCLATRGDGYDGEDLTDKSKFIQNLPQCISSHYPDIYVRGELVILKRDYDKLNGKSARNIVAGLMNRKEYDPDELKLTCFIAYTVLGNQFKKCEQFNFLEANGFKTAWHISTNVKPEGMADYLYGLAQQEFDYQTDGLVLCDDNYYNENVYRPSAQIAFKTNTQQAVTKIIDVDFSSVSKDGRLTPIAILEPVELGGVMISKATLYNSDFIVENNIKYGSTVLLQRSGDVIPKIIKVISNDNTSDIEFPTNCPTCGSTLIKDGVDYFCMNKNCEAQILEILEQFIKKLKIKNVSKASLKKFGITSFDKLLSWRPNQKKKSEVAFYNEFLEKGFTLPKEELFCCFNFKGLSEILLKKILDFYGFEKILDCYDLNEDVTRIGFPDGIGERTMRNFFNSLDYVVPDYNKFISDPRYNPNSKSKITQQEIKGTIIFTGSLSSMSRSNAQKLAEQNGYKIASSVNKDLDYLITANPNSTSSKMEKAKKLGIKIIGEDEFLKLMRNEIQSLDDL